MSVNSSSFKVCFNVLLKRVIRGFIKELILNQLGYYDGDNDIAKLILISESRS